MKGLLRLSHLSRHVLRLSRRGVIASSLTVALALVSANSVQAGNLRYENTSYVKLAFPKTYQGRSIKTVWAKVGLQTQDDYDPGNPNVKRRRWYWQDAHDVQLQDFAGGFFSKIILRGEELFVSSGNHKIIQGPMVEYWLTFSDGTQMASEKILISLDRKFGYMDVQNGSPAIGEAIREFEGTSFSDRNGGLSTSRLVF